MNYMRIVASAVVLACAFPALAQAEVTIAVVDVQKLMTQSDASKSIQKQLEDQRKGFLEDLGKEEKALKAEQAKLADEQKTADKEAFAKKAKGFEEKLLKTRKSAQERKSKLDKASAEAVNALRQELVKVVKDIATEKGYSIVLSSSDVIVGDKAMDISDEAMKRLNSAVKTIKVAK